MNEETINRLKDYSKKLHDRRLIPDPDMMTGFEVVTYNRGMLPSRAQLNYGLGQSLNLFDTTDPKSDDYHRVVDYFNRCISLCVANNVFKDNETVAKLQEFQEKCSELENKLKDVRSLNTQLAEDKIKIENIIRGIFKEYSAIRDKFKNKLPRGFSDDDDDPPESEITRG